MTQLLGGDALHAEISQPVFWPKLPVIMQMIELDQKHPQFGFAKHKGYPTKAHFEAIALHGVIAEHRRSFGPVRKACSFGNSRAAELLIA